MPRAPVTQVQQSPTLSYWQMPARQKTAKAKRLNSLLPSVCFNKGIFHKQSAQDRVNLWHSTVVRVSTCACTEDSHLIYKKAAVIAQEDHGIPRDKFDELIDVLDEHKILRSMDAKDAPLPLIEEFEKSGRKFSRRGKILLGGEMGEAASDQLDYFQRRVMTDRFNMPIGEGYPVTKEELDHRTSKGDEEVYKNLLEKDAARHPWPHNALQPKSGRKGKK